MYSLSRYMADISIIKSWVEESLSDELFIVDVSLTGPRNQQKLKVLLDGDKGVTIDQCAEVSRKLAGRLEENEVFPGAYHLEVSSAGIDQPLKFKRQYYKNIGRQVKVLLNDGKEAKGFLESVTEKGITVKTLLKKKEELLNNIEFENIQHIKVLVTF